MLCHDSWVLELAFAPNLNAIVEHFVLCSAADDAWDCAYLPDPLPYVARFWTVRPIFCWFPAQFSFRLSRISTSWTILIQKVYMIYNKGTWTCTRYPSQLRYYCGKIFLFVERWIDALCTFFLFVCDCHQESLIAIVQRLRPKVVSRVRRWWLLFLLLSERWAISILQINLSSVV